MLLLFVFPMLFYVVLNVNELRIPLKHTHVQTHMSVSIITRF